MTPPASADAVVTVSEPQPLTHAQLVRTLLGLLSGMFVAVVSGTLVANALPTIVTDLGGTQGGYTGIVTANLLALTVSTPIWGKLSDLFSKKLLMQISMLVYLVGSLICAFAPSVLVMIAGRLVQGTGAGGAMALTQIILAALVPARERGRYSGYVGATFATATVSGPLLGGLIVDTSWLGWRYCFVLPMVIAALSVVTIQRTLHLTHVRREVTLDLRGGFLVVACFSTLLLWTSLAGTEFDWLSMWTAVLLGLFVVLLGLFLRAESVAAEPVVPLGMFRVPTVALSTVAAVMVGVAIFSATVYLGQYFQLARGHSPLAAGLMAFPLVLGLSTMGLVSGRFITRTGRWKGWLVGGVLASLIGSAGLALTLRASVDYPCLIVFLLVLGGGIGATMQNLILAVQNAVPLADLGSATSTVSFFRSLGGTIGVSALGALLDSRVRDLVADGLTSQPAGTGDGLGKELPDVRSLGLPLRQVVEHAYAVGIGDLFFITAPLLLVSLIAVLLIKEERLLDTTPPPDSAREEAMFEVEVAEAFRQETSQAR